MVLVWVIRSRARTSRFPNEILLLLSSSLKTKSSSSSLKNVCALGANSANSHNGRGSERERGRHSAAGRLRVRVPALPADAASRQGVQDRVQSHLLRGLLHARPRVSGGCPARTNHPSDRSSHRLPLLLCQPPATHGSCPLCRQAVSLYTTVALADNELMRRPEVSTIFGCTYVQGQTGSRTHLPLCEETNPKY